MLFTTPRLFSQFLLTGLTLLALAAVAQVQPRVIPARLIPAPNNSAASATNLVIPFTDLMGPRAGDGIRIFSAHEATAIPFTAQVLDSTILLTPTRPIRAGELVQVSVTQK